MLAHPGLDAVVLATPHSRHADQMVAIAEAGKHVYCEKPFTLAKADAERAIAAADAAGVRIVVGHNRRFVPAMAERKSGVWGQSGSVRVDLGGRRIIKKKKNQHEKSRETVKEV